MGNSQTKEKSSASEKVVEELKHKVGLLQGEVNEIMCVRERERQVYDRELMASAFKQAEWKTERKRLRDEVKKLRNILQEKQERLRCMEMNTPTCCNLSDQIQLQKTSRDETLEKWKQLYFAIKVELDHLIHTTRQEERLYWKTEQGDVFVELKERDERIEFLQAKLASMEQQELKREREVDILRQSLRIMSHKKRPEKLDKRSIQEF